MSNYNSKSLSLTSLLLGGIIGGIAALLFTPKTGKSFRNDIKNKFDDYLNDIKKKSDKLIKNAKESSGSYVNKAEEILNLSRKFAEGKYKDSVDVIEKEIFSLRTALNAAVDTYRHQNQKDEISIDKNNGKNYSAFEDETLPKREGMGRRKGR